jgi:hypothetical protein
MNPDVTAAGESHETLFEEAALRQLVWNNPRFLATALSASEQPIRCPITGYPCEGDLSHLCEDYGCARKGGVSPRSDEN